MSPEASQGARDKACLARFNLQSRVGEDGD